MCVTPSQAPALGNFWLNSGLLCVPLFWVSPPILAKRETVGWQGFLESCPPPTWFGWT